MTKKNVMISVDEEVHSRAKERGMNISEVCERALQTQKLEEESTEKSCGLCGAIHTDYWLDNYQMWVCKACERKQVKRIIHGLIGRA